MTSFPAWPATLLLRLRLPRDAAVPGLPPLDDAVDVVRDGTELCLDRGRGGDRALRRLAVALHAEWGVRLVEEEGTGPCRAEDVPFDPGAPAAEVFDAVVASCLRHLLANRAAVRSGDPEGVHQVRVAVRRLRSALVLFAPVLEPVARNAFGAELRRVGRVFGAARDWDVFSGETLPAHLADSPGWHGLLDNAAAASRTASRAAALDEMDGPAFTSLVLGMLAWAGEGAVLAPGAVSAMAPFLLDELAGAVRGRGPHKHGWDVPDARLHRLRKAAKRLRYGAEFLSPAFPPGAAGPFLAGCRKLQAVLGRINDASAGTELAVSLAGGRTERLPAVSILARRLRTDAEEARTRLPGAWRAFTRQDPFWR